MNRTMSLFSEINWNVTCTLTFTGEWSECKIHVLQVARSNQSKQLSQPCELVVQYNSVPFSLLRISQPQTVTRPHLAMPSHAHISHHQFTEHEAWRLNSYDLNNNNSTFMRFDRCTRRTDVENYFLNIPKKVGSSNREKQVLRLFTIIVVLWRPTSRQRGITIKGKHEPV